MPDLWPDDFGSLTIAPPVILMKEQADLITRKTSSRILGQVSTSQQGKGFVHNFYLVAPFLDNYSYRLFAGTHSLQLFPLEIQADVMNQRYRCNSPEEFAEKLRFIFAADKTKNVINAIISQTDTLKG